jgi:hypothetical protein
MLAPEFQEFFDSLGPEDLDHRGPEQTVEQAVACAAGSFMAACRLEFGKAPSLDDAIEAVWADIRRHSKGEYANGEKPGTSPGT